MAISSAQDIGGMFEVPCKSANLRQNMAHRGCGGFGFGCNGYLTKLSGGFALIF
jgi:hypothetical protein